MRKLTENTYQSDCSWLKNLGVLEGRVQMLALELTCERVLAIWSGQEVGAHWQCLPIL